MFELKHCAFAKSLINNIVTNQFSGPGKAIDHVCLSVCLDNSF